MIIKKLIIYGYGKWVDTEFDINAPFHLFFGENEAGKSTLMSFVHSIFFGFPTRHSSLNRYEPKESSRYGGRIIVQDDRFGEVSIERTLGKVTGDVVVQLEDGTTGDEAILTTLFYSKSRSFYENIYSFDLKGIEDVQSLTEDQLNRHFLSIGALGHEKFLKQADHYHYQAGKLFKPMGRKPEINQLQVKLKEKEKAVEAAKEKNESYSKLIQTQLSKQDELKSIESDLSMATNELNNLNELSKYQETIEEIDTVKEKLKRLPDVTLPEDGLYQIKQTNEEIEKYQQSISELQENQKILQHQYKPSKELVQYQQNEEDLSTFEKELDYWEDKAHSLQLKKNDLSNLQQSLTEIKIREDIPFVRSVPPVISTEDSLYLDETRRELSNLEEKIRELEEERKAVMYRIKINDDMIDKIEPQLLPLSEFNELTDRESERTRSEQQNQSKLTSAVPLALAAVVSFYLFTVNPVYGLGAAVIILAAYYLFANKGNDDEELFLEEQRKRLFQQKNLREQWKELLAANDDYQSKKVVSDTKITELKQQIQSLTDDFKRWKQDHAIPEKVTIDSIETKLVVFEKLRNLTDKEDSLSQEIATDEANLTERLNTFEHLFTRSFVSENALEKFKEMKRIFREIKREQRQLKEYVKKTEAVQHEITYYVQKVNELKKSKREFIESFDADNQEEVYQLYAAMKEREETEARLAVLLEKLPVQNGEDLKEKLTDLDDAMKNLKVELEELRARQKACMKEIMSYDMQIKTLEDGGIYTELLQEFENEKSHYQEVVNDWLTFKTAAGIIEKTLHHAKEDKLPQALSIAESYFKFLTDEKYQQLVFDEDVLFAIDVNGKRWRSQELSRGTVEPLYIALRLAFIKATKESIRFPVIMDDPFVNLDDNRVRKMYQLLTDFDKDIQLIYFSFDQRIRHFIEDERCVYLTKQEG